MIKRAVGLLEWVWSLVVVPAAAIALSLVVTPAQAIHSAGQTIEVGATPVPLSPSGPGELDLFGRIIPTTLHFDGPIRPRMRWSEVTNYDELFRGLQNPLDLHQDLQDAWTGYFTRQFIVAIVLAGVIAVVSLAVLRVGRRALIISTALSMLVAGAADGISIAAAARGLRAIPSQIRSLDDIVGRSPLQIQPAPAALPTPAVDAVVIGDSTAAGAGNPLVSPATPEDLACRRSRDSYAADIAAVNNWHVVNLACTNATITDGLFHSQSINGSVVPPQLSRLRQLDGARVVIVSIGANEMHWHNLLEICLASSSCDDNASAAWFQQALDRLALDYYDLLQQLAALPQHPRVVVNGYYAPVAPKPDCPPQLGLSEAKAQILLQRLSAFNAVLSGGAHGFGFDSVVPSFDGHELCTSQPFVQGPNDEAPLHPNAGGELAMALSDEQALAKPRPTLSATPSPTASAPRSPSPTVGSPSPTPSG